MSQHTKPHPNHCETMPQHRPSASKTSFHRQQSYKTYVSEQLHDTSIIIKFHYQVSKSSHGIDIDFVSYAFYWERAGHPLFLPASLDYTAFSGLYSGSWY